MSDDGQSVRDRLEADRIDLLDLSLRNPLLNYRLRSRGLEFVESAPVDLFRLLVREGKALAFVPATTPSPTTTTTADPGALPTEDIASTPSTPAGDLKLRTSLPNVELHERLLAIFHAARTTVEEQGVNTLFLGLGLLEWSDDDRPLRAPIVLVPVELERFSARERFRLRHDGEDPGHNLSLAEKLRAAFGLILPELIDPEEADLASHFDAVESAIEGREGWRVDRGASLLGFFSFGKFLMYRDLDATNWPAGSGPADHPVIRALLGEGFREPPSEFEADEDEGRNPGPGDLRLILDADGSQTIALRDAAAGRNLVIQGPPGTGKSQTITNLIADAMGRGRTVLFVAEKLAALEVVKRRLDAAGLGDACLELHSQKTGKKAVLEQLRRTLSAPRPPKPRARVGPAPEELADKLDAFAEALNTPLGATGTTPYEAAGELLQLRQKLAAADPPPLDLEGAETWTAEERTARLDRAERLRDRLRALDDLKAHPFHGSRRASWLPGDAEILGERIKVARHATAALREAAAALARFLRLPPSQSRGACEVLLRAARTVAEASQWRGARVHGEWLSRREDLREFLADGQALALLHQRHDADLLPEAWDADLAAVRLALNTNGRRWWRWFSSSYLQARSRLANLLRGALPRALDDQLALIDAVSEARRLRGTIARHEALAARLFGSQWRGERSQWPALAATAESLAALQQDVRDGAIPRGLLDFLAEGPPLAGLGPLVQAASAGAASHDAAVGRLLTFLELDETLRFGDEGGLASVGFDRLERLWNDWAAAIDRIEGLTALNRQAELCREAGLGAMVGLVDSWPPARDLLTDLFRRARCEALLRRAFAERPILADFEAPAQDRMIAQFREADRRLLATTRAELARTCHGRVPRGNGFGQLALLRRELAKRARHLPVRQLMARAGLAIQAAKPVFLMSPLSVAAYLPPGGARFDLVVFDEASQVRPLDALGALLRGTQAVVVGDSRQLPPSSFFDRLTAGDDGDGDDDEPTSEVESILGLFVAAGAPERMLRWHYRSHHESLIEVSNREFYDGRLVVFPSPDAARGEAGLILHHLPETVYDRGKTRTNPGEADEVAAAVMAFARRQCGLEPFSRRTLGVATFSAAQAAAIVGRLERLRRASPATEPFFDPAADEPFFIKNLENVQGDERDVIFISVGYGRTAEGSVSMNFGPLNAEGGERRLNVLITRARRRCEVFTNLTAEALDSGRSRARGVEALRAFLAHARPDARERGGAEPDANVADASPFEEAVADALRAAGTAVAPWNGPDDGRLDLAVIDPANPGRFRLGVIGDGPNYREAGPARDRDRLRPQVLEQLGWRLHHAWSLDWVADADLARRRLLDALAAAHASPDSAPELEPEPELGSESVDSSTTVEAENDRAAPYVSARLDDAGLGLGQDLAAAPRALVAVAVAEVVRVEGPIHATEVWRRLADATGAKRIGPRIAEAIELAVASAVASGTIQRRGDFLWPTAMTTPEPRDRSALPASSRKLELIAPEELAEAVLRVARESFGIEPDSLAPAAARLLGFARVMEDVRARLAEVVASLRAEGRLREISGHLVADEASQVQSDLRQG